MIPMRLGVAHSLDVGPELFIFGEFDALDAPPVGFGRVDGKIMLQYMALFGCAPQDQLKWQVVKLNAKRSLFVALVLKSHIRPHTSALALAHTNGKKYIFSLAQQGSTANNTPLGLLDQANVKAAIQMLKPLEPKLLEAALRSSPAHVAAQGAFDQVDGGLAKGWATHVAQANQRVNVLIRTADGDLVGFGEANQPRPDLAMFGVADHAVGFVIALSPRVLDGGVHMLYAIDEETDELIQIAPVRAQHQANSTMHHVLIDCPAMLQHIEELQPDCDAGLRTLLEKICVLVELGQADQARAYLAACWGAPPSLAWLLEVKRAELALLAKQADQAQLLLAKAEQAYPLQAAALRACQQFIKLNAAYFVMSKT
ncbi:MAG TPA: hypothetical protein VFV39_09650 [Limnobacter sp.]|nr:hypothetical protein [Limnobacter sp.]